MGGRLVFDVFLRTRGTEVWYGWYDCIAVSSRIELELPRKSESAIMRRRGWYQILMSRVNR